MIQWVFGRMIPVDHILILLTESLIFKDLRAVLTLVNSC